MKRLTPLLAVTMLSLLGPGAKADEPREPVKAVLVVHGGAGDPAADKVPAEVEKRRAGLERALQAGYRVLQDGRTSLDAVEAAIRVLEDDPHFNAGRGAVFTREGRNELDASIMEGKTKRAGAVASVTVIKNPITAARAVMERSRHVLLVGRGAELFAVKQGLEIVDPEYFRTPERLKELQEEMLKEQQKGPQPGARSREDGRHSFGTVGAVALDREGNLAAGTSTGGLTNKMAGRVGDSPIIGAGTYADNEACGISCTGHGEYFIRYGVAHEVVALMKYKKLSVGEATAAVLRELPEMPGGIGGLIALDRNQNAAFAFNAPTMYRGYVTPEGKIHVILSGK
jgi:beta-aspartyl-peptidase (threonine type)